MYRFNLLHGGVDVAETGFDTFELHPKLCYLGKVRFTEQDGPFLPPPAVYNGKVRTERFTTIFWMRVNRPEKNCAC